MNPSSATAAKRIYPHAFRNIEITCMPGTTLLTKQDEELLAAFIRLHDFELEMEEVAETLFKAFCAVNGKIKLLRGRLTNLTTAFNSCCLVADKRSENSYIPAEATKKKLDECRQQTQMEMQDYHAAMMDVFEDIQPQEEALNKYIAADEEVGINLYDVYSHISSTHAAHYEINAIDITAFDEEYDRFLSCKRAHENRRRSLTDNCEKTLTSYNMLNLETTGLYNVWTEFLKRCDLLQVIADLHEKAINSSFN